MRARLVQLATLVLRATGRRVRRSGRWAVLGIHAMASGTLQGLSALQCAVRVFEPWGIVLAVVALFITMIALMLDVEGRQAEKTLRAWAIVTSATSQSLPRERRSMRVAAEGGTQGGGIMSAMEYLNEERPAKWCAPKWIMRLLTAGHTHHCVFPRKRREVFSGLQLRHVVLISSNLKNAVLLDANLENAELGEAKLSGARMQGSNLAGAVLSRADIRAANFTGAAMQRVELSEVNAMGSVFTGTQLIEAVLVGGQFQNANFQDSDLRKVRADRANFRGGDLSAARLDGGSFLGSVIDNVEAVNASFEGAKLQRAKMRGANLTDANLRNANLTEVNFRDAKLSNASLRGAELGGVNFLRANLNSADIREVRSLDCGELTLAKHWELAYRDTKLKCGRVIPESRSQR